MNKWDEYFHEVCVSVGKNTKCFSRQIGAILVRDKSIISTGYNGPPRGVMPCNRRCVNDSVLADLLTDKKIHPEEAMYLEKCPRQILGFKSGEGLDLCVAGHAERNTLINAARHGIKTKGTTLYMDCGVPCSPCLTEIINAGVIAIVVTKVEYYDRSAEYLLKESELGYRVFGQEWERRPKDGTSAKRE